MRKIYNKKGYQNTDSLEDRTGYNTNFKLYIMSYFEVSVIITNL